ncbi:MAG: peroxidase-related enzyme [Bacteroidota bacterium]
MSWIKTIPFAEAKGQLKKLYERVKGPDNNVDNVLMIHSLRPHSLEGHMKLYKNVLHHAGNRLPKWYLEALGVYVSQLNQCIYCVAHHFAGFSRLLGDTEKARQFRQCVEQDQMADFFAGRELAGCAYAKKLTLAHASMQQPDIQALRSAGFSDGEILEINQVVSYFNYVNRMVVGLGVNIEGDILGLSPNNNDDPEAWNHD